MTKDDDETPIRFEDGMAQLEQLVSRLEAGDLALEEALQAFESGVGLVVVEQPEEMADLVRNGDAECLRAGGIGRHHDAGAREPVFARPANPAPSGMVLTTNTSTENPWDSVASANTGSNVEGSLVVSVAMAGIVVRS